MDGNARVVLCQPVYGHVPPAAHLAQITFTIRAALSGHLVGIEHARDTYIDWGRNHAVRMAYEQFPDFTHLLWLDGDICPPMDALERLVAWDVDAVGAMYHKKGPPFEPVGYNFSVDDHGNYHSVYDVDWSDVDVEGRELVEVGGLGLGLTLIKREVFDAIVAEMLPGVWFQTTLSYGEDVWFFHWAKRLGFRVFMDTSLRCAHVGDYEYTTDDWKR